MRGAFAVAALRTRRRRQVVERGYIRKSEAHKVRQRQRAGFSDVAERVAANVVVIRRVGKRADSHAIQHNPDDSFERGHRLPRRKVYSLAFMKEKSSSTATLGCVGFAAVIWSVADWIGTENHTAKSGCAT